MAILSINNLTYKDYFKDFNLNIEEKSFTSIIGSNGSGKTMLTKLICAIIPTTNMCILDGIYLNKEKVLKYIKRIGIATNDFKSPFLFQKVKDELFYPLSNLGYSDNKIEKIVNKQAKYFNIENLLDKNTYDLTESEKSKLLVVLALIHNPKVLVLDDIFNDMNNKEEKEILDKLLELNKHGLTILNITSKLSSTYKSDKIFILNNFKIEKETSFKELIKDTKYLEKLGLDIPMELELSSQLYSCNVIDHIYLDIEKLGDKLWK